MIKFPNKRTELCIEITNTEWDMFSLKSKTLLLYRLRQLKTEDLQELTNTLEPIVEHEKKEAEIDFSKTFKKIYGDTF